MAKRAVELGNGHVDILINNAGIFPFGPTNKTTEEEFDTVCGDKIGPVEQQFCREVLYNLYVLHVGA